jgi:hypothetical protein
VQDTGDEAEGIQWRVFVYGCEPQRPPSGGDRVFGLGPEAYAREFGLPPPISLPLGLLRAGIRGSSKTQRGPVRKYGFFYGPLAWKPPTNQHLRPIGHDRERRERGEKRGREERRVGWLA